MYIVDCDATSDDLHDWPPWMTLDIAHTGSLLCSHSMTLDLLTTQGQMQTSSPSQTHAAPVGNTQLMFLSGAAPHAHEHGAPVDSAFLLIKTALVSWEHAALVFTESKQSHCAHHESTQSSCYCREHTVIRHHFVKLSSTHLWPSFIALPWQGSTSSVLTVHR